MANLKLKQNKRPTAITIIKYPQKKPTKAARKRDLKREAKKALCIVDESNTAALLACPTNAAQ